MRTFPLRALRLLCLCCALLTLATTAHARDPLLQEGKKTLFQRVVTHPGATVHASPSDTASGTASVRPFTALYVYARNGDWLEVGPLGTTPLGWIKASATTAWNQSLTLLLTPRSGRDPLLFFKTESALEDVCNASNMSARLKQLQEGISKADATSPVLAMEPDDKAGAVAADRFYLMPILNMKDPFEGVKFLEVASIDPGSGKGAAPAGQGGQAAGDPNAKPRVGIAIVIDTTISMRPYIERSLEMVRSIYNQLEKEGLSDDVGFAVVAYRNSLKAAPKLGYDVKLVSDFATARNRAALEDKLSRVQEATASSHSIAEDAALGVKTALDSLSWGEYSTRLLMLISDAGPLPTTDNHASIRMDMPELADYARAKGVWITPIHIKSPSSAKNHQDAARSYKELGQRPDGKSNYFEVPARTPAEGAKSFGQVAMALSNGFVNIVRQTKAGKLLTRPKSEAPAQAAAPQPASPEDKAKLLAEELGYALQLEFLGKQRQNQAPRVVDAWIADTDLNRLAQGMPVPAVEVAVLLTKNQLNDLSQQLRVIIDNAERTRKTDSRDFFQGILSASARMARDPNAPTQGKSLAQLGILAEFLDGLPYKSDIMLLREEDWYRMSVGEQTAFINRLKSRLARYEEYDKDRSHWESFGATNPGDWMYRVPLAMLP